MPRSSSVVFRWRFAILGLALVLGVVTAVLGPGVARRLDPGGFAVQGGVAAGAAAELRERFGAGAPDIVAVLSAPPVALRSALGRIEQEVTGLEGVLDVHTPLDPASDALAAEEGSIALVLVSLSGDAEAKQALAPEVLAALRTADAEVAIGGEVPSQLEGQRIAEHDLVRGEIVALPVVAVLLLVFFRGPVAAILPLCVGGLAIGLATTTLRALTHFTTVSVFALNVVTFLGLGLAIDYSLFIVQRFREELAAGMTVSGAVGATIRTAGKTVVYSGSAVAVSLLALAWIPIPLLRSIAVGGALVVAMTVAVAVFVLPAILGILGTRVGRGARVGRGPRVGRGRHARRDVSRWHALATAVMKRPALVAVGVSALLLSVGAPVLRLRTAVTDATSFPATSEIRRVQDRLDASFAHLGAATVDLLVEAERPGDRVSPGELLALADRIRAVGSTVAVIGPGEALDAIASLPDARTAAAARAQALAPFLAHGTGRLQVHGRFPPGSPEANAWIEALQARAPPGLQVTAAGRAADAAESHARMMARLPWAAGTVAVTTFVVLLLAFGAVPVALKAIAMNVLSLTTSFGALVWVFQDGRFEGLLDYTSSGAVDPLVPILMFAIVFGLSMDYELFLLSRIREDYDQTGDAHGAVARGLETTAGLITSAALLLIVVMVGFAAGRILFLRALGIGMALAVFVDATLVRALLVPSTMALMGRVNFWAPAWFGRWWTRSRIGVHEGRPGEEGLPSPTTGAIEREVGRCASMDARGAAVRASDRDAIAVE